MVELAHTYDVSVPAVRQAISREGLEEYLQPSVLRFKEFIPWTVRAKHSQKYPIRCLRLYCRSLGLGAPLVSADLTAKAEAGTLTSEESAALQHQLWRRGVLFKFEKTMDANDVVVTYDRDAGFYYVPRRADDAHMVRWPEGVPDHREEILARLSAHAS